MNSYFISSNQQTSFVHLLINSDPKSLIRVLNTPNCVIILKITSATDIESADGKASAKMNLLKMSTAVQMYLFPFEEIGTGTYISILTT